MKKQLFTLLAVLTLPLLSTCEIESYPYYINRLPAYFTVTAAGNNSMSICQLNNGASPLSFAVTAYNEDGSVATTYNRPVALRLLDAGNPSRSISMNPSTIPSFSNGRATIGNIAIPKEAVYRKNYILHASDARSPELKGQSTPFLMDLLLVDHIQVTLNTTAPIESSFPLTVRALDSEGRTVTPYAGYVALTCSLGQLICSPATDTPSRVKLTNGSWTGTAQLAKGITESESSPFTISAVIDDQEGDDIGCPSGTDGFGFEGDGSGGGGGGGGSGGAGGGDGDGGDGDDAGGTFLVPDSLVITSVTPSKSLVRRNELFNLTIRMVKEDASGTAYTTFNGDLSVTSSQADAGLAPASGTANALTYVLRNVRIDKGGKHTLTVRVEDNASDLWAVGSCEVIVGDVGIYGESSAYLQNTLNARTDMVPRGFILLDNLNNLSNLDFLIVNMAGSAWGGQGGQTLTTTQAEQIKAFHALERPVLIAHDAMTDEVFATLAPIFGAIEKFRIEDLNDPAISFQLNDSAPWNNAVPALLKIGEIQCDGFTPGIASDIVTTDVEGQTRSLILAAENGARSVLIGESLYHTYKSEGAKDYQWWVTDEQAEDLFQPPDDYKIQLAKNNRQLVVNIINWLIE